jgi:hypothetical protein
VILFIVLIVLIVLSYCLNGKINARGYLWVMDEQKDEDLLGQLEDFDALFSLCAGIAGMQAGKTSPGQEFLYNAEGLGKKIMNHALTARYLLKPMVLANYEPKVDFSSIAVLTRAALESYLIFYWVFVSPKNDDEKEFRFHSWVLGGLNRTKYKPAYGEYSEKWQKEMDMAEDLRKKIQATSVYQNLKPANQEKALEGELLTWGWFRLTIDAGFNEPFFRKIYMYLSNYAHSNRVSIIQVQQINAIPDQQEMGISAIGMLAIVLGKFMYDYVAFIPVLKEAINLNDPQYGLIMEYKTIGEKIGTDEKDIVE